jgi:hypothetical protein
MIQLRETSSRTRSLVRLSDSTCERAHVLGVPTRWVCRSSLDCDEMMCAPVWGEDAHEMGVSFVYGLR